MERVWSTSRRGFSARSVFMFVLTVLITALLWVTLGSHTPIHAADAPAATWKGASILYNGHQYFVQNDVKSSDSIGLPQGTHYYLYTPDTTNSANSAASQASQKAFIIYFAPGTDPPKETAATQATYDYSASKEFSNQTDKQSIAITIQGDQTSTNSCTIQGIGWIICPMTTFLADGMDNIFNLVKGFLVVQAPNTTNTNNDLYIAWNVMRSIANVAFIIVFMIIIYSQLTNAGVSNYGLKKLLPRLIVAAVLVNVSYFICAIAVDISNILGYSLQDIFVNIRKSTFNINNDTWASSDGMGWSAVTAFILSGGAASIGVLIATGGTIGAALYLLVPILIGLLLTILLVLVVLAARQAIIIILIVIAPLAFVAFLLPNTEQLFKKWRELFLSMLVFFPAFSLVFGGSQLAGGIIIQNATTIVGVIFGMAVQVAPLAITPLILRLSGGILGKIAGMVNNPKKGLLDRTKAWSGDRAAMHKQRGLRDNNLKWYNGARKVAQALDNNKKNVKNRTDQYTTEADNRYHRTSRYARLHEQTFAANQEKELIEKGHEEHIQNAINSRGSELHLQNMRLESVKARVDAATKETEIQIDEYRSGRVVVTGELGQLMHSLQASHEQIALGAMRRKSAQDVVDANFQARFVKSDAYQAIAGGVGGQQASNIALASAIAAQGKAFEENGNAARALTNAFNLSVDQRNELAQGNAVTGVNGDGLRREFKPSDAFARSVAITDTIKAAPYGMGLEIIKNSGSANFKDFRGAIAEAMDTGGWESKGAYFDGETRDAMKQGSVDDAYLTKRAAEFIANGKLSPTLLASQHKSSLAKFIAAKEGLRTGAIVLTADKYVAGNLDPITGNPDIGVAISRVKTNASTALTDVRIAPGLGDRTDAIKEINDTF